MQEQTTLSLQAPLECVPLPTQQNIDLSVLERAAAACETVNLLKAHGMNIPEADDLANEIAATLVYAYASDPNGVQDALSDPAKFAQIPPAVIVEVNTILSTFGRVVARQAVDIRNLVVNKLILESENADPRIRIKALELLGKITEVGLFTERKELTVTHKSSDELKDKLKEKLLLLKQNSSGVYEAPSEP